MRLLSRISIVAALIALANSTATIATAQTIDTLAGGGIGDGFEGKFASVKPNQVSVGPDGVVYLAEPDRHRIRKIGLDEVITTIAGAGGNGFAGDGGPATAAQLNFPAIAVADATGTVFICDGSNHRIRRIDPGGTITTIAGSAKGFADGPALSAQFDFPRSMALDATSRVLIADPNNKRIRRLEAGAVSSVIEGLGMPLSVYVRSDGALLVVDSKFQRVEAHQGTVVTPIAGTGVQGTSADGTIATAAPLFKPIAVSANAAGEVFIAEQGTHKVRVVRGGTLETIAGTGTAGYNGDDIPAKTAKLSTPSSVAIAPNGDVVIAEANRVRRVDIGTGKIRTIAGVAADFNGDELSAALARFESPSGVARDAQGNVYIADANANRVRKIDSQGKITTVAGTGELGFSGDNGPAISAKLSFPFRVAVDGAGALYILDMNNHRVRRVVGGTITTVVGSAGTNSSGDGGPADQAALQGPRGLAVDAAGSLYIADAAARRVRKVSGGIIQPFAGNGTEADLGDGGPALSASFKSPSDVAVDALGNVYVSDSSAHRVRVIDTAGKIRTLAGTGVHTGQIDHEGGNPADDLGDGRAAELASLHTPLAVAVAANGDVFIADKDNHRVRRVRGGTISTLVGSGRETGVLDGEGGNSLDDLGDGGPLSAATFNELKGLNASGELLVADFQSKRVRVIRAAVSPSPVTPTASPVPTATPTASPTASRSATATATPINTHTASHTATHTAMPSSTATATPTNTEVATATRTLPPPATLTPTATDSPIPTFTRTQSPTLVPTTARTLTPVKLSVGGTILYHGSQVPVGGANVLLNGQATTMGTDGGGVYLLALPPGNATVTFSKVGGQNKAITSADAAHVLKAKTGTVTLDARQRLACDVTGDGTISSLDARRILEYVVAVDNPPRFKAAQQCGSDWAFVPTPVPAPDQAVTAPLLSAGSCVRGSIAYTPVGAPVVGQNFAAVLFGDCTLDWKPQTGPQAGLAAHPMGGGHMASHLKVRLGQLQATPGGVKVPALLLAPASAGDVVLSYNAARTMKALTVPAGITVAKNDTQPGELRVAFASATPLAAGQEVFTVELSAGPGPVRVVSASLAP